MTTSIQEDARLSAADTGWHYLFPLLLLPLLGGCSESRNRVLVVVVSDRA